MVRGIDSFRDWFLEYQEQYAVIGGTACDLLMDHEGMDFRATKDIDLVLIVESVDAAFGKRLWEYVTAAGYEHINKSTGRPQFYRFSNPRSRDYPAMIELFAKKPESITLPEDAMLVPLPIDEDISSLSAILLNDDYYEFLKHGRIRIADVTILDALYLIPLKAKAWIDLTARRSAGEQIDSRNIRKHKNDVFRLTELLTRDQQQLPFLPMAIRDDMREFTESMRSEDIDLKQIGIRGKTKEAILDQLRAIYCP